jgi:hypothetical protein
MSMLFKNSYWLARLRVLLAGTSDSHGLSKMPSADLRYLCQDEDRVDFTDKTNHYSGIISSQLMVDSELF